MSDASDGFGQTLTGGIQDISALLPLLGTEQCEKHAGSASEGGFLYAAATPLSIFGSLGIIKTGISVLIASISIPSLWIGARTLDNAGFELVGTVASLITIHENPSETQSGTAESSPFTGSGKRFRAETRLIEILKEKDIDDTQNVSVEWESTSWNIRLILSTIITAGLGLIPYIHLIRVALPSTIRLPWLYPVLRTVGSGAAIVCCQLVIQHRIVSLMKMRIIFMNVGQQIADNIRNGSIQGRPFTWDPAVAAEESFWSLKQYLTRDCMPHANDVEMQGFSHAPSQVFPNPQSILDHLESQHQSHFSMPIRRLTFFLISWILLLVSLPVAVIGYIGCFSLVAQSDRGSNGPFIWLALETVLAIIRIALWAWNPPFDQNTEVNVKLKLLEDTPPVTTDTDFETITSVKSLDLIPERQFLERVTPFTGPLDFFQRPEHTALFFTLTGTLGVDGDENNGGNEKPAKHMEKRLFLTLVDSMMNTATTLCLDGRKTVYYKGKHIMNHRTDRMTVELTEESNLDSQQDQRRLLESLQTYYLTIMRALSNSANTATTRLSRNWALSPKVSILDTMENIFATSNPPLLELDLLYLERGYEHRLKIELMNKWGLWNAAAMKVKRTTIQYERYTISFAAPDSEDAEIEFAELGSRLIQEFTRRELMLLKLSDELEKDLYSRMERRVKTIAQEDRNQRVANSLLGDLKVAQKARLQLDIMKAKERLKVAMDEEKELAGRERRYFNIKAWADAQHLLDDEPSAKPWFSGDNGKLWNMNGIFLPAEDDSTVEIPHLTLTTKQWSAILEAAGQRMANIRGLSTLKDPPNSCLPWSANLIQALHSKFLHRDQWKVLSEEERTLSLKHHSMAAAVRDARGWDIDDLISKSEAPSFIHADRLPIKENEHLLYFGHVSGKVPRFVQRNRTFWWLNAAARGENTWKTYFSPEEVDKTGLYAYRHAGPIAHIMMHVQTRSHIRLRLVHQRSGPIAVVVQNYGQDIYLIQGDAIHKTELSWQQFMLGYFDPGDYDLTLVVKPTQSSSDGFYGIRDIRLDFTDFDLHSNTLIEENTDLGGGNRDVCEEPICIHEISITSTRHPDIPKECEIILQIIIDHEVVEELPCVTRLDNESLERLDSNGLKRYCWTEGPGGPICLAAMEFSIAVLRKDSSLVNRLLGIAKIKTTAIPHLVINPAVGRRTTTSLTLMKVNDDGPDLTLESQFSRPIGRVTKVYNIGPPKFSLKTEFRLIERDLHQMRRSKATKQQILAMYERLLLIPSNRAIRAMLLSLLGNICLRDGPDRHWAIAMYADAVRDSRCSRGLEPVYRDNLRSVTGADIFALVIGIDEYASPLRTCIYDSEAIVSYLWEDLTVPRGNVMHLKNTEATHDQIINGFEEHLIANDRIQENASIIFYFAGYGGNDPEDCEFTVIFDVYPNPAQTCENGEDLSYLYDYLESLETPYADPPQTDEKNDDARHCDPTVRSMTAAVGPSILLTACVPGETTFEAQSAHDPRETFTSALITALRSDDEMTYHDLISRLDVKDTWTPYCYGANQHRRLFSNASNTDLRLSIITEDTRCYVLAGSIHGIESGTIFQSETGITFQASRIETCYSLLGSSDASSYGTRATIMNDRSTFELFQFYLKLSPPTKLKDASDGRRYADIKLKFKIVSPATKLSRGQGSDDSDVQIDGTASLKISETYGFQLRNKSPFGIHVYVFYFHSETHSIKFWRAFNLGVDEGKAAEAAKGPHIRYFEKLSDHLKVDTGYIKIYASPERLNASDLHPLLSSIGQDDAFVTKRVNTSERVAWRSFLYKITCTNGSSN